MSMLKLKFKSFSMAAVYHLSPSKVLCSPQPLQREQSKRLSPLTGMLPITIPWSKIEPSLTQLLKT